MNSALLEQLRARFDDRFDAEATPPRLRPADEGELAVALSLLRGAGVRPGGGLHLSRERLTLLGTVEPRSATVEAGAGALLAAVERHVRRDGLTLGPLSPGARALTVAAFLEGDHAGLRAIPGGRLEPISLALRALLPGGLSYRSAPAPRSAAGPGLDALLLGGGGRLGLIVSATLRLMPVPARTEHVTVAFPTAQGLVQGIRRALEQGAPLFEAHLFRRASAHVAHARLAGSDLGAVRDANTFARCAAAAGGRLTDADLPVWTAQGEQELSWPEVEAALAAERPLRLHRLALDSVIAELQGPPASRSSAPAAWLEAVAHAVDPEPAQRGEP